MKKLLLLSLTIATIISCKNENKPIKPDVVAQNLDTTVSPDEDFFLYANGGWIKNNPIPEEQSSWGIGNLVIDRIGNHANPFNKFVIFNKVKKVISHFVYS